MSPRGHHPTPVEQRISAVSLTFGPEVPLVEVEGTLQLAPLAAEAVHGEGRVDLDATACHDREHRRVRINTTTAVGRTLALVFLGYCRREFGRHNLVVERVPSEGVAAREGEGA